MVQYRITVEKPLTGEKGLTEEEKILFETRLGRAFGNLIIKDKAYERKGNTYTIELVDRKPTLNRNTFEWE